MSDRTQWGDDVAYEMRQYFEDHREQKYTEGCADSLMLGLLNIAASAIERRAKIDKRQFAQHANNVVEWLENGHRPGAQGCPRNSIWALIHAWEPALAAATGTAKTAQQAECEASQSGPQGNAHNPSGPSA